ncbi:MAG: potassium channel family protein [Sphingomicrobium sp.]
MAIDGQGVASATAAGEKGPLGRYWGAYGSHRYAILFFTLLFTLAASPVASAFGWSVTAMEILLGVSLIAAVMPHATRKSRTVFLAGVMLLLLARAIATETHQQALSDSALGLWVVIGLLAAAGALRFVLKGGRITSEHIFAALSAYLLAGLFFGMAYFALELAMPGSFGGPSDFTRESAIYFSFVTLATLGYGDFLPKTDMMRGLVVFEVIGGQLFLAVMIARLVGLSAGPDSSD